MVSIYANKKRHHRKKGPWIFSSCPWTLGTLPYLTRLLDLVCRAARVSYSCHVVLKSVCIEWDFPGVSPKLYMLQALSNVVFLAHKDYSAPVIREQHWDAKVIKKIFFSKSQICSVIKQSAAPSTSEVSNHSMPSSVLFFYPLSTFSTVQSTYRNLPVRHPFRIQQVFPENY